MSPSIATTLNQIWKKLTNKEYRDAYVGAHISNTVASQISMLRDQRGWTQKELAQRADMSQSRISALEDPNYENFEVATLRRLAGAFDVALTVRFIPFSELTAWTADLSEGKLLVSDFANDQKPTVASAAPARLVFESYREGASWQPVGLNEAEAYILNSPLPSGMTNVAMTTSVSASGVASVAVASVSIPQQQKQNTFSTQSFVVETR